MSGTIIIDNSCCQINTQLDMRVIKDLSGAYFLKLCCPKIVEISNACGDLAAINIPKCFELGTSFFELTDPSGIQYAYYNMTNGLDTIFDTTGLYGSGTIIFQLDDTNLIQVICIDNILIPVTAKCIGKDKTFNGSIGTLLCLDSTP
jgi:hypothetical protein